MSASKSERDYDIVLFGATGFAGSLTADYLAANAPTGLRWAIAGRNRVKLDAVAARLNGVEVLIADAADAAALSDIARRSRVIISTVGPYLLYGEPIVAACAAAGTDYVDLTGEPEFVDRMYLAHHDRAVGTGARIVHACGFDSIPHDLGALFTVGLLGDDEPITMRGVVRSNAAFSGGTLHSALNQFSRASQLKQAHAARSQVESRPQGRSARAVPGKPHRDRVLGYWLLPLPTIDPMIVARSGAALASYGPKFRYTHWASTKTLRFAAAGVVGVGALGLAAQIKPVRNLLLKRVPAGSGPDEAKRAKSWFSVDFIAESGDRQVRTRVSGGDPGYTETAKMLAESALCLAFDDNPDTAGQVTSAVAMGAALTARLMAAGITFETR